MKSYLNLLLGAVLLYTPSLVLAGPIEDQCASTSGYTAGTTDPVIVDNYNSCIASANASAGTMNNNINENPTHPGNPPVQPNCNHWYWSDARKDACRAEYQGNLATYNAQLEAYNEYVNNQNQGTTAVGIPATQVLENLKNKILSSIERLKNTQKTINIIAAALAIVAAVLMAFWLTTAQGIAVMAVVAALTLIANTIISNKIEKLSKQLNVTCESYNKVATEKLECTTTNVAGGTGSTVLGDSGVSSTVPEISTYVDSNGLCRPSAPAECNDIVKNAPAGCFKKGGACMATKPSDMVKINPNGTVTGKINGKAATIGLEDLKDEASMIKAGFTSAQAKQFFSGKNNPFDMAKSRGLDVGKDFRNAYKDDLQSLSMPSLAGSKSSTPVATTPIQSEYVEKVEEKAAERDVASADGITKEFKGDQIGLGNDDVFKMINRRYNLKKQQNNFLDQ